MGRGCLGRLATDSRGLSDIIASLLAIGSCIWVAAGSESMSRFFGATTGVGMDLELSGSLAGLEVGCEGSSAKWTRFYALIRMGLELFSGSVAGLEVGRGDSSSSERSCLSSQAL
jgi:hypothetical protein